MVAAVAFRNGGGAAAAIAMVSVDSMEVSNEIKNRPVFKKLMQEELQTNDLLMVTKIDRCSRNTLEFLKLQDVLFKQNIIS